MSENLLPAMEQKPTESSVDTSPEIRKDISSLVENWRKGGFEVRGRKTMAHTGTGVRIKHYRSRSDVSSAFLYPQLEFYAETQNWIRPRDDAFKTQVFYVTEVKSTGLLKHVNRSFLKDLSDLDIGDWFLNAPRTRYNQKARNTAAVRLLDSWMNGDSDEQRETFDTVKELLKEDRNSQRALFSEN